MKKIYFSLILLLVVLTMTPIFYKDVSASEVNKIHDLNQLVEEYTNNGTYVKETTIYINEAANLEIEKLFHAQSTHLERTTYYCGDALWMSRGKEIEGVKYSYYGTHYTNGIADGVTNATATTPFVHPEDAKVVLSGSDEKSSMENYYITLKDMVATDAQGWVLTDNVYSSDDLNVIDYFRQFTAPCFLEINENTKNYFIFTKATIEEVNGKLLLSLYISSLNEGSVSTPVEDGHCLFSQAIITYPTLTYSTNDCKYTKANYNSESNEYSFTVNLSKGEKVNLRFNEIDLNFTKVNLNGISIGMEHTYDLYTLDGHDYDLYCGSTLGGVYTITYNNLTNTVTAVLEDTIEDLNLVGSLVPKTWEAYEAFSVYARRNDESISIRLVSNNNIFTSEGRQSKVELYFVTGDNLVDRNGNSGVTRIIVNSNKTIELFNYGKELVDSKVDYRIDDRNKTVIDLEIPYSLLGTNNEEVFGINCGLWSTTDSDWAPMYALDTTTVVAVERLNEYIRCDKDNQFFRYSLNASVNKEELTRDYLYQIADPDYNKNANADDIYLKVSKNESSFTFDMIGFGKLTSTEYVKLILHTSSNDSAGWGIQESDVTFLVSSSKAMKRTGMTSFWEYVNFGGDVSANHVPVYNDMFAYFTLSFEIDFVEIPNYDPYSEVSFIGLEFGNGVIYEGNPLSNGMLHSGVGVGDPANQANYKVIQKIASQYKYQFSTNYYANITKGENGLKLSLISFEPLLENHFIRLVVDTDGTPVAGVWNLDASDVSFTISSNKAYVSTGNVGFWQNENTQFHTGNEIKNSPTYVEHGEYWTIELEIDYSELGLNINRDSVLKGLLIAFTPVIENSGFNFDGIVPSDVAQQSNYFEIK